jgi:hypothetical protein
LATRAIYLRSVDHRFFRPVQVGVAREDGSFGTVPVPPGRYALGVLESYPGYQLTSVMVGGREVGGSSFELDRDIADAELRFSPRPTVLEGSVAGEPGQARFVLTWPEDESLWSARGTGLGRVWLREAAGGSYRIPVFPGTYRLIALDGVPPADWEASAYLRQLAPFAERVIATAGSRDVRSLRVAKLPGR